MTDEERKGLEKWSELPVSYGYFCDEPGEEE